MVPHLGGGLLGLWLLATVITVATGGSASSLEEMGLVPGLPATSVLVVWLYAVLVNGLGEETGWRGFLQPLLQRSFRPRTTVVLVSVIWAAWHLPLLPVLTSFEVISGPAMLPVFWFGLAALSVVLAWVYDRSGGSVLIAAPRRPAGGQRGLHRVRLRLGRDHRLAPDPGPARRSGGASLPAAPMPLTEANTPAPKPTATVGS